MAKHALKILKLDTVRWLVARGNPLKLVHGDFKERCKSAQLHAEYKRMLVRDPEQSALLTYSINIPKFLNRHCLTTKFVCVMGNYNLENFHRFRNWEEIANLIPFA